MKYKILTYIKEAVKVTMMTESSTNTCA